ncbi:GNAT family N-acetyltransferase [Lentzea sp. BCCO 10_0798]|uniref:GNAT family N-acetyltransferase n=1 Tax=Lentzea kristufekii TaxID=3095430 RepID=A0ABU4U0N4_9PSEU|nr:GNAT family N-acetyltransferase [Lentzea sp. BCCO 10_0798]MDX8053970.1 GNAT family N-acetyltransferase [Lentzea sp. BCCO 10_0798]
MTTSVATTIRDATAADLEAARAIYNHAVLHTDATLDTDEKTPDQMSAWLAAHSGRNAAVVAERDGEVIGYGTLSPFATRGGYFPSTEISIYIAPGAQGMGVGSALTGHLVDFAREEGYSTIISFNTDTNIASIRMIERYGFVRTGVIQHIGVKLGKLVNLAVFQLIFTENLPRYQDEQDATA